MPQWILRRNASRVVLLGPDRRVFLIEASDPNDPSKPPWWEIPGGGIEGSETSAETALRELAEEGGFDPSVTEVGPIVWTQHVEFTFGGIFFDQDEVIHVAWTKQSEIELPRGLEFLEALAFRGSRWWTLEEVQAHDGPFLPPRLPELLGALVAGDHPDPPLDLTVDPVDRP